MQLLLPYLLVRPQLFLRLLLPGIRRRGLHRALLLLHAQLKRLLVLLPLQLMLLERPRARIVGAPRSGHQCGTACRRYHQYRYLAGNHRGPPAERDFFPVERYLRTTPAGTSLFERAILHIIESMGCIGPSGFNTGMTVSQCLT